MIEKKRLTLAALLAILLTAGVLGLYVYHNGRRVDPIRGEYQRAAENQLTEAQTELQKARELSNQQGSRLNELKTTSIRQEESLRIANESLAAYEKENNRTHKRLKAQRNLAYGIGTVLLAALVRK